MCGPPTSRITLGVIPIKAPWLEVWGKAYGTSCNLYNLNAWNWQEVEETITVKTWAVNRAEVFSAAVRQVLYRTKEGLVPAEVLQSLLIFSFSQGCCASPLRDDWINLNLTCIQFLWLWKQTQCQPCTRTSSSIDAEAWLALEGSCLIYLWVRGILLSKWLFTNSLWVWYCSTHSVFEGYLPHVAFLFASKSFIKCMETVNIALLYQ